VLSWEEAVDWLRRQPDQQELVRACFFDDPLNLAARRFYQSSEWRACRELLPAASGEALDLGAGRGIATYALCRDGWRVTALEPDPSNLVGAGAIRQLAHDESLDVRIVEMWGENLPFESNKFDVVLCRQVLHHSRDLGQLCREIGRVLKTGGVLLASREHVVSSERDLNRFLTQHPLHALYGGENAFTLKRYVRAIESGGLKLDSVLNAYASDINMYPDTVGELKRRFARRAHLPNVLVPRVFLRWIASVSDSPGRLYTFRAIKA
jgi:SAM-dependent methyltransferase